jgi:hypothetical protein
MVPISASASFHALAWEFVVAILGMAALQMLFFGSLPMKLVQLDDLF